MATNIIATIVFTLTTASSSHAYLDPGSGSYILQLVLAAFFGALFTMKVFWSRIKSFFNPKKDSDEKPN